MFLVSPNRLNGNLEGRKVNRRRAPIDAHPTMMTGNGWSDDPIMDAAVRQCIPVVIVGAGPVDVALLGEITAYGNLMSE